MFLGVMWWDLLKNMVSHKRNTACIAVQQSDDLHARAGSLSRLARAKSSKVGTPGSRGCVWGSGGS